MPNQLYAATATIGTTEWSLTANAAGLGGDSAANVIQAYIDLSAMLAGDEFQIRYYDKVVSGGSLLLVGEWVLTNAQSKPIWTAPAMISVWLWDFTVKKIAGTDRSISWSLRSG